MTLRGMLTTTAAASLLATTAMADIKIGASLPLTGAFSVAGAKHQQGYQLCVDLINEAWRSSRRAGRTDHVRQSVRSRHGNQPV